MSRILATLLLMATVLTASAQNEKHRQREDANSMHDSLYILEVEEGREKDKVLHAEPLYVDLIRDLGARKGEREWNFGMGITDNEQYDSYNALVEYEFAPADRLGMEVELPFNFYMPLEGGDKKETPSHRLESFKTAIQWTFLVSQKHNTSLALGYINELLLTDINKMSSEAIVLGNKFNPFLVAAKRWGQNFHTLVYTGVHATKLFNAEGYHLMYDVNTNIHYMIPGTRNFVGVELNKELADGGFDMTIRPQLRLAISNSLLIGIVGGIPVSRDNERLSSFVRFIWEPGHSAYKRIVN